MFRKMTELLKRHSDDQLREVRSLIATTNASILTGSVTPPPFISTTNRTSIPSTLHMPPPFTQTIPPSFHTNRPPLNSHPRPPDTHQWDDGSYDEDFQIHRRGNQRGTYNSQYASKLKADIPIFYGLTNNEAFVDWVADVEDYFAYVPVDDNLTTQLVALRLKGCAKA